MEERPKRPDVKGEYVHFSDRGVFVYRYRCERCGKVFAESCPEVSAPCLCHICLTRGGQLDVIGDDVIEEHPANLASGG